MGISKVAGTLLMAAMVLMAQPPVPSKPDGLPSATEAAGRATYVLGPDDVISIRVLDADEITDKNLRVPPSGSVNLAMVGRVQLSGLTAEQIEHDLTERLKPYIRNPQASVTIIELRSQPVSILGAVNAAGIHQLQGRKTLVEVLSLAGGVRQDAGYSVKITRLKEWGPIPLEGATDDSTGKFSVAEVKVSDIMEARKPEENILVMPNDVITVPKADTIYIIGEVKKVGAYILGERQGISVLQALSMGGGLEKTASAGKAKILRASGNTDTKRIEIDVNLKNILTGKDKDVAMQPEDILFVPGSRTKTASLRVVEAMIQIGTGLAMYRGF